MDVDEDVSKMTLSLIIGGTSKPLGSKEKKAGQRLELGSAYTCKVADVSEDGLAVEVDLEDGSEVVKCHVPKVCSRMQFFPVYFSMTPHWRGTFSLLFRPATLTSQRWTPIWLSDTVLIQGPQLYMLHLEPPRNKDTVRFVALNLEVLLGPNTPSSAPNATYKTHFNDS